MSIKTEPFGESHVRTFSDAGKMIQSVETGALYVDAVDPVGSGREYIETMEPAPPPGYVEESP